MNEINSMRDIYMVFSIRQDMLTLLIILFWAAFLAWMGFIRSKKPKRKRP